MRRPLTFKNVELMMSGSSEQPASSSSSGASSDRTRSHSHSHSHSKSHSNSHSHSNSNSHSHSNTNMNGTNSNLWSLLRNTVNDSIAIATRRGSVSSFFTKQHNQPHEHEYQSIFKSAMKKKRLKFLVASTLVIALIVYQDTLNFSINSNSNTNSNTNNNTSMKYKNIYEIPKRGSKIRSSMSSSSSMSSARSLRQGNNMFAKTPYVSPRQALKDMPLLDPNANANTNANANELPSHVELCQELIQRNFVAHHHKDVMAARARNLNQNNSNPDADADGSPRTHEHENGNGNGNLGDNSNSSPPSPPVFTKYTVHESPHLCKDYKHPHSALMQIISSSIIAYVGQRFGLDYQHKCHTSIDEHEHEQGRGRGREFDITTVQQVFPQATMPVNERELSLGQVVHNLCQSCIDEYEYEQDAKDQLQLGLNPKDQHQHQKPHQKSHHCLAFPRLQNVHEDTIRVQKYSQEHPDMPDIVMEQDILDSDGHLVRTGLGAVLPLVKNRLNHAAGDWATRAHIPSHDPRSGAVIYFDAGDSVAVPFWVLQQYVETDATHVSILTGPDCAKENLRRSRSRSNAAGGGIGGVDEGVSCIKYALELKDYFTNHYKDKDVEVSFNLVSSTATAYTRMIMCHTLVCLPGTISCFLPALAKPKFKNAVILESQQQSAANYHWFTALGQSANNIQVVTLSPDQLNVDQEQKTIDTRYSGFSVNEIIGSPPPPQPAQKTNAGTNANGNVNEASSHHVANLNIATTTLNKSFAPKDHLGEGYQLVADGDAHTNVNANANANADHTQEKHAVANDGGDDGAGGTKPSSSSMFKSVDDTQADIEDKFGKGTFLFGNNDGVQKASDTDQGDIDSTRTGTVSKAGEQDNDSGSTSSEDKKESTNTESPEKDEVPTFDFEGLFGGGGYR